MRVLLIVSQEQEESTDAYRSYPAAWLEPLVGSFAQSLVRWTKKLEVDWVGAALLDPFAAAIFFVAGSDDDIGLAWSSACLLVGMETVLMNSKLLVN